LWAALGGGAGCAASSGEPRLSDQRLAFRFLDRNGRRVTLGALRGRPLVVHVMTTWSDLALLEVPLLVDLWRDYEGRLEILALVVDRDPETLPVFADTFDVPYRVGRPEDVAGFLSEGGPFGPITRLPTSFVLDGDGRLRARNDGTWDPKQLRRVVRALLPRAGPRVGPKS
jgi:hypothetical protein